MSRKNGSNVSWQGLYRGHGTGRAERTGPMPKDLPGEDIISKISGASRTDDKGTMESSGAIGMGQRVQWTLKTLQMGRSSAVPEDAAGAVVDSEDAVGDRNEPSAAAGIAGGG